MRPGGPLSLLFGLAELGIAARAGAQISPGALSAPHAALEGSANCLSCHRAEKGVDPDLMASDSSSPETFLSR